MGYVRHLKGLLMAQLVKRYTIVLVEPNFVKVSESSKGKWCLAKDVEQIGKKPSTPIKDKKLDEAVNEFASDMKDRLAEKERKGYKGWEGSYQKDKLLTEIQEDVLAIHTQPTKKKLSDIANRIMMLSYRIKHPNRKR